MKISKESLKRIIKEEINKLVKEYEPGDARRNREDQRFDYASKTNAEIAAKAQKSHEQGQKLKALLKTDPNNELIKGAIRATSFGDVLTRDHYPRLFTDPQIAAALED
jgi:hypothetical protein